MYLEIGVAYGATLALSSSRTVGVDPEPHLLRDVVGDKPWLKVFRATSDDFFREHSTERVLEGFPLDLVFIDGLHEFVQVVRDLEHVERWAHPDTVVVIHDVLPGDVYEASQAFHEGRWTEDVWRIVPFLQEHRPDLACRLVAVTESGALIVTRLDPGHPGMAHLAADVNRVFPGDGTAYDRLVEAWLATARPEAPDEVLRVLLERTALGSVGFGEPQAPDAFPGSAVTAASTASPVKVLPSSVNRGMRILPETSWRPVLQRSIDAFYESALDEGIAACLTLLNEPALPAHIRDLTYRNQVFYARPLADLVPGARWQALEALPGDTGALRDPSPLIAGERLIVVMRDEASVSASAPLTLALADADLPAMEVVTFPAQSRAGFTFCEARPFAWQGEMYVAAIRREGEDERTAQAVALMLRDGEWVEVAALGPRAGHFRQGWSPVVTPDGPRFVSWWEPTEVFQFDAAATAMEREALRLAPHLAERFRGGSPGIAVPGGYLWLVNETVATEDGPDETLSRFVRTDAAFQIAAVSPQFFLTSRGHDVATGLARHGEQLIAGFTSAGSGPVVATMDIEPILAVLIPVAAPGRS